jgi:predicted DNA-binding protein (UPF0251 family)
MKIKSVEELKQFPEADLVLTHIKERWRKGLYSLVLVNGLPGTGKSSLCCRLSEKLYMEMLGENKFKSEDIVDNLLDLVRLVKKATPDKLSIIVVEEISVLFPSRRAMSGDNVDIAQILDTCRKKKIIIFANAPVWSTVDSHIRTMANVYIQTIKVYKKAKLVLSKCYSLQTDPRTGKTYTHNFKRNNRDVNKMYTLQPNQEVWEEYEKKKDGFLDKIYSKVEARQIAKMKKDDKLIQKANPSKVQFRKLTTKELQVHQLMQKEGATQTTVAKEMGVSIPRINQILKNIKKKAENAKENQ